MRLVSPGLALLAMCSLLACNSIIGIDGEYTLLDDDGNGGGGGGGGGQTCFAAGDCPTPATPCRVANCKDKVCGEELVPEGAGCNAGGGELCNADGDCVECLSDGDCLPSENCDGTGSCVK